RLLRTVRRDAGRDEGADLLPRLEEAFLAQALVCAEDGVARDAQVARKRARGRQRAAGGELAGEDQFADLVDDLLLQAPRQGRIDEYRQLHGNTLIPAIDRAAIDRALWSGPAARSNPGVVASGSSRMPRRLAGAHDPVDDDGEIASSRGDRRQLAVEIAGPAI